MAGPGQPLGSRLVIQELIPVDGRVQHPVPQLVGIKAVLDKPGCNLVPVTVSRAAVTGSTIAGELLLFLFFTILNLLPDLLDVGFLVAQVVTFRFSVPFKKLNAQVCRGGRNLERESFQKDPRCFPVKTKSWTLDCF